VGELVVPLAATRPTPAVPLLLQELQVPPASKRGSLAVACPKPRGDISLCGALQRCAQRSDSASRPRLRTF